jgi:HEAT repeat protein
LRERAGGFEWADGEYQEVVGMRLAALTLACLFGLTPLLAAENQRIKTLAEGLRNPDSQLRAKAAMALAEAGADAKEAVQALSIAVEDRDLNVRYWAVSALKNIGQDAKGAVPALVRALKTFPGGVPELEGPARYFPDVRAVAAEALGNIGNAAEAAIPDLKEAAKDENAAVREAASAALKKIMSR